MGSDDPKLSSPVWAAGAERSRIMAFQDGVEGLQDRLSAQVERVRTSDILGKSDPLRRIFEYLAKRAENGGAPSEFEIACEALGKDGSFDVAQDASIRAYVFRLRKKLEDFYHADPSGGDRLSIPKGSYRLVLEPLAVPGGIEGEGETHATHSAEIQAEARTARRPRRLRGAALACVAAAALGVTATASQWLVRSDYPHALAASPAWRPLVGSALRTHLVIGDQPLPGGHPHVVSMGSAVALTRIVPIFNALVGDKGGTTAMVGTSFMSPGLVKESNIVYIGTFSQMGLMTDVVFARSGFAPPDGSNVLTDRRTGRRFVSQPPPYAIHRQLTSYGYIACLLGPSGNRILVISGGTDGALVQMAEIASDAARLGALMARAGDEFEALYAVDTIDSVNVAQRLVMARPPAAVPARR